MRVIHTDISIIGAGLTGLSLGYYLKKEGKDFRIVEKDDRIGGVINTCSENGFVYESGPNTGVIATGELAELFEDLDPLCKIEKANSSSKKRLIWKNGKWNPLPSGLISALNTPLFSLKDKLRIAGEPFRRPGRDPDETVARLVVRRLGKSYLDYAVDPFIRGIYAGDPGKLITRYSLPRLYNLEHRYGSFIRGAIRKKTEVKTETEKKATREVFSAKGGLLNFVRALGKEAGESNILPGCPAVKIEKRDGEYVTYVTRRNGEKIKICSPRVVTTNPAPSLESLLPFLPGDQLGALSDLRYAPIILVVAGYGKWDGMPLDAFGGLVPSCEKRDMLGILFPSSIFKGRAPDEGALLSVFMGGINDQYLQGLPDEKLKEIAVNEIKVSLKTRRQPDLLLVFRYENAIPQYEISSKRRLAAISRIEKENPGLVIAGNIRDGIGMADRVKQAKEVAGKLCGQS